MTRDESLIKDLRDAAGDRDWAPPVELLNEAASRIEQLQSYHKPVQDMSLRELFDHVAIVNDAVRAAIAGHPGCEPVRREEEIAEKHERAVDAILAGPRGDRPHFKIRP